MTGAAGLRVAVVGAGVVGLSTTAALLERGAEVVCYERSGVVMNERSAGDSRIFRLAHRTPGLVRLAAGARAGFDRWSRQAGQPMVVPAGCVISGCRDAHDRLSRGAIAWRDREPMQAATPLSRGVSAQLGQRVRHLLVRELLHQTGQLLTLGAHGTSVKAFLAVEVDHGGVAA